MIRRRFASEAEYYRHHRKVFLLALELGVTPAEAEAQMRRMEQRERLRAAAQRRCPAPAAETPQPAFTAWDAPWMARD